jgi:hypothetical protein
MDNDSNKPPDNFISIIQDFTRDLTITFPEYSYLWTKWYDPITPSSEYSHLYTYCLTVYPERFFDILYQNDDIFSANSEVPTLFLPYVEFKLLYNCADISENTKKTLWKYLQLIMVTIMNGIQDKSIFGDTANLFDGINEEDLHSKLSETIQGLSDFFKQNVSNEESADSAESQEGDNELPSMDEFKKMFDNMGSGSSQFSESNIPNPDELNDHLKNLFGGKIGTLAKELAEELSGDIMNMFGEEGAEVKSTQDVLKKIMKNPKKLMDLLKSVGSKLDKKMKSGDISQEELMKEAGDIMGKMKEMGGGKDFQEMMKKMTKNMAGMAGMGGKNAKFDMNALTRMTKAESSKERMRNKLAAKQTQSQCVLEPTQNPNNLVFKIEGEEPQQKSTVPINDDWLDEPVKSTSVGKSSGAGGAKKKKGKGKK